MTDLTNLEIAWFDLGLSKGKQVERERIIKLLETYIEAYGAPEEKIARNLFTRAIREIKGEQNNAFN